MTSKIKKLERHAKRLWYKYRFKKIFSESWKAVPPECPVDVVYTYVDCSSKEWNDKYFKVVGESPPEDRYRSFGELGYSIKSVMEFAPFIRNIYIVTDNQVPPIEVDSSRVTIIDHSQIIGDECFTPTFKSTSIESYIYRIKNLSEVFLYLNDDMFLGRPIQYGDLIRNGIPECDFIEEYYYPSMENDNQDLFILKPWEYENYNAASLIFKKYNILPQLKWRHQMAVIRKTCCHISWELFGAELSECVSFPTRSPYSKSINVLLLSQYLGVLHGYMRGRTSNSPFETAGIYEQNMDSIEVAKDSLRKIKEKRPHLFCINAVTTETEEIFHEFVSDYFHDHVI